MRWISAETGETLAALGGQGKRTVAWLWAAGSVELQARREIERRRALGLALEARGIGDESVRARLAQTSERIAAERGAGGKATLLQREWRELSIRLADDALARGLTPEGLEELQTAAHESAACLADRRLVLRGARERLVPQSRAERRKVGLGVTAAACLAGVFLLGPGQQERSSGPAPVLPHPQPNLSVAEGTMPSAPPRIGRAPGPGVPALSGVGTKPPGTGESVMLPSKTLGETTDVLVKPSPATVHNNEGSRHLDAGRIDQAITSFNEAIRSDPAYALAYSNRGLARAQKGDRRGAVGDLSRAVRLNPGLPLILTNRASVYIDLQQFDRAVADCDAAIRLDPKYAPAYGHRGLASIGMGNRDRAMTDFNEAIRLDPTIKEPWNNRADTWTRLGQFDRAIVDASEAIRLDPNYTSAWNNRAVAHSRKGSADQALADASEAIRLDPNYQIAWANRGMFWAGKREYDRAIRDLSEAIRLDPRDAEAFAGRSVCHRAKGDEARAQADFARYQALSGARP